MEVELLALAGVYHSPAANAVTVVYRARPADPGAEVEVDAESSSRLGHPVGRTGLAASHCLLVDGRRARGLGRRAHRGPGPAELDPAAR